MIDPIDPRTIFLAKHAQHVVLIHFPIALFITGVGCDLLARGKRASQFDGFAYLNFSIAAASLIPAIGTGLLAWQFALEGKHLKGLLLMHLLVALLAAVLIAVSWWIHWRTRKAESAPLPRYRIPIELLGVGVVALAAHLGGFLSGVNS